MMICFDIKCFTLFHSADLSNLLSAYLLAQLSAYSTNVKIASCLSMVNAESLRKSMQGVGPMTVSNAGVPAGVLAPSLLPVPMQPAFLPGAPGATIPIQLPVHFALPYPVTATAAGALVGPPAAFAMQQQGSFIPFACEQLAQFAIGGDDAAAISSLVDGQQLIEVMGDGQNAGSHIMLGFSGSAGAISQTIASSGVQCSADLSGSSENAVVPDSDAAIAGSKSLAEVKCDSGIQSAEWNASSSCTSSPLKW